MFTKHITNLLPPGLPPGTGAGGGGGPFHAGALPQGPSPFLFWCRLLYHLRGGVS